MYCIVITELHIGFLKQRQYSHCGLPVKSTSLGDLSVSLHGESLGARMNHLVSNVNKASVNWACFIEAYCSAKHKIPLTSTFKLQPPSLYPLLEGMIKPFICSI